MNLGSIAKGIRKAVARNSASILASFAVTGVVATSVMVGRATFKAADILREAQLNEDLYDHGHPLDIREKVRLVWREYIPAAGIAALTVASVVGGHRVQTNKIAALSAAYAFAERSFDTYRDKVIEKIGERKNLEIRNEIAEERMVAQPMVTSEIVVLKEGGDVFHDAWSGRYFTSDIESVRAAANDTNAEVYSDYSGQVPLTFFYERIGLPGSRASDSVGFSPDRKCELIFTTALGPDGRPCHAIDFVRDPSADFQNFH